jgi:hypothetical protein
MASSRMLSAHMTQPFEACMRSHFPLSSLRWALRAVSAPIREIDVVASDLLIRKIGMKPLDIAFTWA